MSFFLHFASSKSLPAGIRHLELIYPIGQDTPVRKYACSPTLSTMLVYCLFWMLRVTLW